MVYDLFPFFNELDILKLHLEVMDPYVDRFVIEEAKYTFSGQPKELCFEAYQDMFAPWLDKIEYIVVDELGDGLKTHERDYFQKNHLAMGLTDAKDDDVIIFGDVDEVPNPEVIKDIVADFDSDKVYHLAQRMFYVYLNMEEVSGKLLSITGEFPEEKRIKRQSSTPERKMWLGTKVMSKKNIPEDGIIRIREFPVESPKSVRISDGGWHFGYMGSLHETDVAKRIGVKVVAAAHQEYNTEDILKEAKDRLILGQDMFGRDAKFVRVDIDESYPTYLKEHIKDYEHLVMPKVSDFRKKLIMLKMKGFRFARRCRRYVKRKLYDKIIKRFIDILLSGIGIVLLAIPMGIIAIIIKAEDPGPAIFKQKRVGINKNHFMLWKFRSMKLSTPHDVPTHMLDNPEQYLLGCGKFIRKYSLDELPQLFNIFTGRMSIIGPRPALWNQFDLIEERDKYGANDVRPGLTGWAQINGRDELEIPVKAKLDGEYAAKESFLFDCKCFFGTFAKVFKHEGVVEGGTGQMQKKSDEQK